MIAEILERNNVSDFDWTFNGVKSALKEMGVKRAVVKETGLFHAEVEVPGKFLGDVKVFMRHNKPLGIIVHVKKLPFWKCWFKKFQHKRMIRD